MITVLEASKLCAKTHRWKDDGWQTIAFDEVKTFEANTIECNSIDDLHEILQWLETQPKRCIIHGELIEGASPKGARTLHDQPNGDKARFKAPAGAKWLCLDIDTLPCPDHLLEGDDEATILQRLEYVAKEFPADFADTTYVYQWSASAAVKGWNPLKVHLYFWIDNPKPLAEVKARAKAEAWPCDLAPLNPVQIHYTAAPIFEGRADPLAGIRTGIVRGSKDAVTLSAWAAEDRPKPKTTAAKLLDLVEGGTLEEHLDKISLGGHYHGPIMAAMWHYCQITPLDQRDQQAIIALVKERMIAPPDGFDETYLNRVYEGAAFKCTPRDTEAMRTALARKFLSELNKRKKKGALSRK